MRERMTQRLIIPLLISLIVPGKRYGEDRCTFNTIRWGNYWIVKSVQ